MTHRLPQILVAGSTLLALVLWPGCKKDAPNVPQVAEPTHLTGYPNPFGADDPQWTQQPRRENPLDVVALPSRGKAFVSLQGSVDEPGNAVAVVDLEAHQVIGRIGVGSGPSGLAMHPAGRWMVVTNRFSNHVSVVDVHANVVVHSPPAPFYTIEAAFTPEGDELWLTNRHSDAVMVWDVRATQDGLLIDKRLEPGVLVGTNPRDLAISPSGTRVAVAALTGTTVSMIDRQARAEVQRVELGAPANGLAWSGEWLVVATLSASTHHQALAGPDTNGDGLPGDGTPNVNFQDLQNELAVVNVDGDIVWRYTSDSICCADFRDVDPADLVRHGDLLPEKKRWIVGGALPEQVFAAPDAVWVTYSGSNQVQRFTMAGDTGELSAGVVGETHHAPHGLTLAGDQLLVAHRLGETVGFYDPDTLLEKKRVVVGDVSGGGFPATDAEIGELFNFVTGPFSVDGDQACAHCHREGSNIDKAFSMPLTRFGGVGSRMTMAYRGAADTRPWFFEAAMDETNFRPVMNEFARIENFCCTDYTLWPDGPPADCATNPPKECLDGPNAGSSDGFDAVRVVGDGPDSHPQPRPTPYLTRDAFYLAAAQRVMGRTMSFGDGVYYEDVISGTKEPVALDFNGITRALGLFLLQEPRLLPNPNPLDASARRGEAIFESVQAGCASCHPKPTFAVSTVNNPNGLPLTFGPVVSPNRAADGTNLDLTAAGFMSVFPAAMMDACPDVCGAEACTADPGACDDLRNVYLGVPSLRGIWDRADHMLHDGRAKGLVETLATPGHPALEPGQTGFNESDGIPDTHGSTSHLTAAELRDLIRYLRTL